MHSKISGPESDLNNYSEQGLSFSLSQGGSFLFIGNNPEQILEIIIKLAKIINCSLNVNINTQNKTSQIESCGECTNCQLIAKLEHPDLFLIAPQGASGSIKINQARMIKERIYLKPFQALKKIFIIKDAQRLTPEAANALLKILEEPPQDVILILTSDNINQLLPTVVSRTKLVRIKDNAEQQNFQISEKSIDAEFAGIDELIKDFFQPKQSAVYFKLYEKIAQFERKAVESLLERLAYVFRDLIMLKTCQVPVLFLSSQAQKDLEEWSLCFNSVSLEYLLERALKTQDYIRKNSNIKLAMDILIKKINKHKNN